MFLSICESSLSDVSDTWINNAPVPRLAAEINTAYGLLLRPLLSHGMNGPFHNLLSNWIQANMQTSQERTTVE